MMNPGQQILMITLMWTAAAAQTPEVPETLKPPRGESPMFHLHAKGDQIYMCQKANGRYAWSLKGPDAKLFSEGGAPAGHHFAGPAWEARDGSRVTGKLAASVPSPKADAIPWLLLTAVTHEGNGTMTRVQSIQRLHTKGGKAPATECDASREKAQSSSPYEAEYYFYGR